MLRNALVVAVLMLFSTDALAEVRGQVDENSVRGGFRAVNQDDEEEDDEDDEDGEEESDEEEGDEEEADDGEEGEDDDEGGDEEGEESEEDGWIVVDEDEEEEDDEPTGGASSRYHQREVDPDDPWAVRITPWPLFELTVIGAPIIRLLAIPIDRNVDTLGGRGSAHLETGYFGIVGFNLAVFPFARFDARAIRGLGAEWSMSYGLGLTVENINGAEGVVDSSYDEVDFNLIYTGVIGRLDLGAQISGRIGFHQTSFYLGSMNNDLIAPFEYDAMRIDVGVRVPLRTRHLLAEARGAYLFVPSPGPVAAQAYGDGTDPSTHGAEVRVGLLVRVGGLEFAFSYVGRWFTTTFEGEGFGFGDDPSTRRSDGGPGIQTLESAKDSFQQIRLTLGYRW